MKRSMKQMTAILLTLLMALSLAACAAPAVEAPPAEVTAAPEAAASEAPPEATPVDFSGQKLVIWTNLTADAQYEVLSKQFNELAKELGYDAGFGPKKFADDVASFAVTEMVKRGMK